MNRHLLLDVAVNVVIQDSRKVMLDIIERLFCILLEETISFAWLKH